MAERDDAWQRFFEQTNTLQQIAQAGCCYVTAESLKRHGQREPRLMAKIDTLAERPRPFQQHHLSIFPTKNGEYILFQDPDEKTYYRFSSSIQNLPLQEYTAHTDLFAYDSFPGSQRLNESQAIDFAYISSLLHHFTRDDQINLAIRGRAYSNPFHFYLPSSKQKINVSSVQIEIDAGYESPNTIYLIEAKVGRRNDFNIRQLYYPYLEWRTRSRKRIVPIFLAYTNGQYYLTEFRFAQDFGDLHVVRSECYVINEDPRPSLSLKRLLAALPPASTLTEPSDVPYPQANDLDKVLDVVAKVDEGISTKLEIADAFEFDERQGDYYANAACYLGLLKREEHCFSPTEIGVQYLHTRSRAQRNEIVVCQLLMRPTFRAILTQLQQHDFEIGQIPNHQIAEIIAAYTPLTGSTPGRRAQTVRSWLATLLRNAEFQN
jgi:hypothetical protein